MWVIEDGRLDVVADEGPPLEGMQDDEQRLRTFPSSLDKVLAAESRGWPYSSKPVEWA